METMGNVKEDTKRTIWRYRLWLCNLGKALDSLRIELSEILYPPVLINRVPILQSIKNIVSGVIASDRGRKTIRVNGAKVYCERPFPKNVMEAEPFISHQRGWLKRPETVWHQEVC